MNGPPRSKKTVRMSVPGLEQRALPPRKSVVSFAVFEDEAKAPEEDEVGCAAAVTTASDASARWRTAVDRVSSDGSDTPGGWRAALGSAMSSPRATERVRQKSSADGAAGTAAETSPTPI